LAKHHWKAKRYRAASVAWTQALARAPVTVALEVDLERLLYLRCRSKAYHQCGWPTLALDDIERVLQILGIVTNRGLWFDWAVRVKQYVAWVDAYRRLVSTFDSPLSSLVPPASASPSTPSTPKSVVLVRESEKKIEAKVSTGQHRRRGPAPQWVKSCAYLAVDAASVGSKKEMCDRALDDLEHYAIVLGAVGDPHKSVDVYRCLVNCFGTKCLSEKLAASPKKIAAWELRVKELAVVIAANKDNDVLVVTLESLREPWLDSIILRDAIADSSPSSSSPSSSGETKQEAMAVTDTSDGIGGGIGGGSGGSDAGPAANEVFSFRKTHKYGIDAYARRGYRRNEVVWMEPAAYAVSVDPQACHTCMRTPAASARIECKKCGAIYCNARCSAASAPVHRVLCHENMRAVRADLIKSTGLLRGSVALLVLQLLAGHWAALEASRIERDAKQPKTSSSSSSSLPSSPPLSSLSSPSGDGDRGVAHEEGSEVETWYSPFVNTSDPNVAEWLLATQRIDSAWLAGVDERLKVSKSRQSAYGLYEDSLRLRLPHLHPQMLNFGNFYAALRITELYGFGCRTAADMHGPDRIGMPCSGVALYPAAGKINHECAPNLEWYHPLEQDGRPLTVFVARATRPIAPGERLTVSYADDRESTEKRQEFLRTHYGFVCDCPRCIAGK
jgi:hypothetical protein